MPTRCWCEKFALVIGFVPSHKSNIERFRKIWRESLLKIYNSIFKTTLDELHKAMFQNRHLDIHNFDPFVKSLISRYPANPSVPSSHFLFSRCFNKTLRLWHGNLWKMRGENDGLVWRLNSKTSMLLSSFEESFKGRTSSVSYIRYCLIQYNFLLKVKSLSSKNLVKTTATAYFTNMCIISFPERTLCSKRSICIQEASINVMFILVLTTCTMINRLRLRSIT